MKIISWNVNGIRAAVKKDFVGNINAMRADVICLQETKAQPEEVEEALAGLKGYHTHCNSAEKKGYSSTAILTKSRPLAVQLDMGVSEHDAEGRVMTAEFIDFYLVTVYVPNAGRGLPRLEYRQRWDHDFLKYVKRLEKNKPVVICGDMNVAHQPIDLARPKSNYDKTAGYTQVEIDGFSSFLKNGFKDAYRELYPEEVMYSWWSYMFSARQKNIGWRIDYFLVSAKFFSQVKDSHMLTDVMGSDHCPIVLELDAT